MTGVPPSGSGHSPRGRASHRLGPGVRHGAGGCVHRRNARNRCDVSAGFDPARELLAAAFARTDFETMPETVRTCPREHLSEIVQVALSALDEAIARIRAVDCWEGCGDDLLDWTLRGRVERGDGQVELNRNFIPLSVSASDAAK